MAAWRSVAVAPKCQRYGGTSHDQPSTSPGAQGLHHDQAPAGNERLQRHLAVVDQPAALGLLALGEHPFPRGEPDRAAPSGRKPGQLGGAEPGQHREVGDELGLVHYAVLRPRLIVQLGQLGQAGRPRR